MSLQIVKFIIYTKAHKSYMHVPRMMDAQGLINALSLNTKYVPYFICNAFSTSLPIEPELSLKSCEGLL